MSQWIKEATTIKVRVGPFVEVANGYVPVTTATITGGGDPADEAELLKAAGVATVDISARTFAAITGCDGYYDLTLNNTADTTTLGDITIVIQNDSLHLPVRNTFMVVASEVWDALFSTTGIPEMAAGAPPSTANMGEILAYFYMTWRNKKTSTASEVQIFNDAGTAITESTQTEAAGTYTKEEFRAVT